MKARWVGKVGVVGVRFESNVGVRGILGGEVCGEVVEAAVVRFAYEGDAFQEGFGGGGIGVVDAVNEAEAVCSLQE